MANDFCTRIGQFLVISLPIHRMVTFVSPTREKRALALHAGLPLPAGSAIPFSLASPSLAGSFYTKINPHTVIGYDLNYPESTSESTCIQGEIKLESKTVNSAEKFDTSRAGEYEEQSRIALAGYDACHELAACMLAASLKPTTKAHILVVGAGGPAKEITNASKLEPDWLFTAVDPSQPMLEIAKARIAEAGLTGRTTMFLGRVEDLPEEVMYDAATLIGVLHHIPGDDAKLAILKAIGARLKPGAPLVLAGNRYAYASQPLLLAAWGERWRMHGCTPDQVKAKLGKILQGADPPHSEEAVADLLADAGFDTPISFFSSLFWSASLTFRAA